MPNLDWSQCDAVESVPGRVSGAWVLKDTRMPVQAIFSNLQAGATVEEVMEWFEVTREQMDDVLGFVVQSFEDAPAMEPLPDLANAHSGESQGSSNA